MDQSAELLRPAEERLRQPGNAPAGAGPEDVQSVECPSLTTLRVCAIGLSPADQAELDTLFAAPVSSAPKLVPVDPQQHSTADVILIDGRDAQARDWWRSNRGVLHRRPMVWMDQRSPYEAHTTVARPVVWPMMALILYRASQIAPVRPHALVPHRLHQNSRAVVVVCSRGIAGAQLRWMLDGLGYRVTVARNAREGLAALHAAPYDGVVLAADPHGAPLDVVAICKRIRSLERRVGQIPVLVLDSEASAWQRLRARWAGSVEIAPWPAHAKALADLLQSLPAAYPARHSRREMA
jgi:CheY-like chemotaxis protein